MKIYRYEFNMTKCNIKKTEYECCISKSKEEGYKLIGSNRVISYNRLEKFYPFRNGDRLIAWSFVKDYETEFRKVCLNKVVYLRQTTIQKYDMIALTLIGQI